MSTATPQVAVHAVENLLFFTLLQLVVIQLAARFGGSLALHVGQARLPQMNLNSPSTITKETTP